MTDISSYLNLWLIPLFVTAIFFYIQFKKSKITEFVNKKIPKKKNIIFFLIDSFKLKIDYKYILLAIVSAILLNFSLSLFFNQPLRGVEPLFLAIFLSGIMAPIAEEFICRGFLLGLSVYLIKTSKINLYFKKISYFIAIIIISLAFTISHNNITIFQYILRFSTSILFSIFYLKSDRNLLIPIIGHAAGNWFINMVYYLV